MGYPRFEVYFPSFQTEPDHTQGKKIEPQHTQHIYNKEGIKGGATGGAGGAFAPPSFNLGATQNCAG